MVRRSANKKDAYQNFAARDTQQKVPETSLLLVFGMIINKYEHIPEVMAAHLHQELQRYTSHQPAIRIISYHTASSKDVSHQISGGILIMENHPCTTKIIASISGY